MRSLILRMMLTTLSLCVIADRASARLVIPSGFVTANLVDGSRTGTPEPAATVQVSDSNIIQVRNPIPTITALEPNKSTQGSGAITVIVRGSGFIPRSKVKLNDVPRPTRFIDSSELRVVIPASILHRAGEIWVTVYNPPPGGGHSNSVLFAVENPVPTVTSIAPTRVGLGEPRFTLFVRGTNFVEQSEVRFDGVDQRTQFDDSANLRVKVQSNELTEARVISVTVFNPSPGGGVSNTQPFVVVGGTISGRVYEDRNGNGSADDDDEGMSSATVWLMENNIPVDSTLTTSVGSYTFENLQQGIYGVRIHVPPQWMLTQPLRGSEHMVGVTDSSAVSGIDFGIFKEGRMSGFVFNDENRNGLRDTNEQGLPRIRVGAWRDSLALSAETQTDGAFSLTPLLAGVYALRLSLDSGWIQTHPDDDYHVTVRSGTDTTGICFGVSAALRDAETYRTFLPESISVSKAIKPKPYALKFYFEFQNQTEQHVDGLHVEFARPVISIALATPFPTIRAITQPYRSFDFTGATVARSQVIRVIGFGAASGVKVKKWWWMSDGRLVGTKNQGLLSTKEELLLPMPNAANLRNEVFLRMAHQPSPAGVSGSGIIIGVPQLRNGRSAGWVVLGKSMDVVRSLRSSFGQHNGEPRGFDVFENGRSFTGEQKGLSPIKQNNRLFADLVTLKLNISASELQLTPIGLGELLLNEDGNPLSGMMVREIACYADTSLTYWSGRSPAEYRNLDSTIRKINAAFSGDIDTISFGSQLRFTGARALSDVPFLRANPHVQPRVAAMSSVSIEDVPPTFRLWQNYPNPFNPITIIEFELAQPSIVTVTVFDVLGKQVAILLENESLEEGSHALEFDGGDLTSGVYFYRIAAFAADGSKSSSGESFADTRKMILLK